VDSRKDVLFPVKIATFFRHLTQDPEKLTKFFAHFGQVREFSLDFAYNLEV